MMTKLRKKERIILILILVLATWLRVYRLDKIPPGVFGDEADVGYHAYSLLKTGKDYYGQFLPTYIHSLAEWRAPLLMYVTAPFIGFLGVNEWGLRISTVFFGILSLIVFYGLIKKLFQDELIALLSTFFLATSPWHIQYNRMALELSLLLFLFLLAIWIFLLSFKKNWLLILSALLFGLTPYTYSTANILMPLLLGLVIIIFRQKFFKIERKMVLISVIFLGLMLLPIGKEIIFGHAAERAKLFSVFSHQEYVQAINIKRAAGNFSLIERFFHNRPLFWLRVMGLNYMSAFSPLFLLERGDVTFRHSVHEMGQIFWVQLPLLILGIAYLLAKADRKLRDFWLGWLLLAPIPTALTWDGACHTSRLFLMIPPLMVISSLGVIFGLKVLKSKLKKTIFVLLLLLFFLGGFFAYLHRYFIHYPIESWRWWHVGYKETMDFIKNHANEYQIIVINNTYEPALLHFLFETGYDPAKFQKEFQGDKPITEILPGIDGFSLEEKYYFGTLNQTAREAGGFSTILTKDMLYLVSQEKEVGGDWDWRKSPPTGVKVLKTATNPYDVPIFYLVTHE